jgi:hypothetical protein
LTVGQRIPADCLIIESSEFTVLEQELEVGEMRSSLDNPFLKAGSFVQKG